MKWNKAIDCISYESLDMVYKGVKGAPANFLWHDLLLFLRNGVLDVGANSEIFKLSGLTFTKYIANSTKEISISVFDKLLGKEWLKIRFWYDL